MPQWNNRFDAGVLAGVLCTGAFQMVARLGEPLKADEVRTSVGTAFTVGQAVALVAATCWLIYRYRTPGPRRVAD